MASNLFRYYDATFAFFVVLLSLSASSPQKFSNVIEELSLNKQRAETSVGDESTLEHEYSVDKVLPQTEKTLNELQKSLTEQGLDEYVGAQLKNKRVDLKLKESVLFKSGEAVLLEKGFDILRKLTPLFSNEKYKVSVEGNTDNIPISNHQYPSNWELSGARASAVARALIEFGISESRLKIVGHAHTNPIDDNETLAGRQNNRRVNLILYIEE